MVRLRKPSQHVSLRRSLRDPGMRIAFFLLLLFTAGQVAFWNHTRAIRPEMGIVPAVPGERTVKALSFGDDEAFFRLLALNIQNSGDTFGRFTALYKYDFNKLYHWFHLLDRLNNESNYLPAMASYYFSQTQNPKHVRYLVDYLEEYTDGRPKEKWWWVVQGAYLALHKMKDDGRALQLAAKLQGIRGIPIWAQQLPAFIHEDRGEFGEALAIIEDILKHPEEYSEGELNFMRYFVDERLNRLKQVEAELEAMKKLKAEQRAKGIPDVQPIGPPSDVGAPTIDLGPKPE
jgi:hypothetical protein